MKLLEYAGLGKTRRMRKLLDRGGKHFPIDAYDAAGWTALHHACGHGHAEAAQLLLRYPQASGKDCRLSGRTCMCVPSGEWPASDCRCFAKREALQRQAGGLKAVHWRSS